MECSLGSVKTWLTNFTGFIYPNVRISCFISSQFDLLLLISATHSGQEEEPLMLTWVRHLVLLDVS